ncbi:MAG: uracil-DNA glycosylase [Candidatus Marinimicrobia bacterium]|nr:uracil-DNA glycosylase [Candidatus Neomarinimicrobiota bacterium]MCF7829691.1 uracil-DNA glycosylase [Candidatus Neomarinimicrobiota bacterium]MCF7881641.1 uracil-DNA glycosylase [Candidatus Neomarinimicrobiota bacterium]
MNEVNNYSEYLKQQAELFPEDFYIRPFGTPGQVAERGSGEDYNPEIPPYEPPASGRLADYKQLIHNCKRCPLGESRTKFVFGTGDRNADLMFIGEAPGYYEDQQGEPFVGKAGKLLDKILAAIDLKRENVFIGNVLKCRPPENRDPKAEEIEECEPYLVEQIRLVEPRVIIALGKVAGNTLLRKSSSLRDLRGKTWDYHGTDLIVTYHPAALLRNQNLKRPAWEDFQKIQEKYLS